MRYKFFILVTALVARRGRVDRNVETGAGIGVN
jgi:hypothetical protein